MRGLPSDRLEPLANIPLETEKKCERSKTNNKITRKK